MPLKLGLVNPTGLPGQSKSFSTGLGVTKIAFGQQARAYVELCLLFSKDRN